MSAWQAASNELGTVFVGAPPEETRPKVISAARKALELDPDLAEAHVLLANVQQEQWHWADAEAEYRRALELNPNDADAHAGLALWLVCQGRTDEAVAWAQAWPGTRSAYGLRRWHRRGFCFSLIATMRPYASCAACWRCNRTTRVPFRTLDSRWSPTINPRMQSPFWRKPSPFRTVARRATGVLVRAYSHAGRRRGCSSASRGTAKAQKGRLRSRRRFCERLFGTRRKRAGFRLAGAGL